MRRSQVGLLIFESSTPCRRVLFLLSLSLSLHPTPRISHLSLSLSNCLQFSVSFQSFQSRVFLVFWKTKYLERKKRSFTSSSVLLFFNLKPPALCVTLDIDQPLFLTVPLSRLLELVFYTSDIIDSLKSVSSGGIRSRDSLSRFLCLNSVDFGFIISRISEEFRSFFQCH